MPDATARDGTRLHYQVTGRSDGPSVLLVQGLGADKHGWDLQRLALARRHRTIAFDNRGAGQSGKPPGPYSLAQMATDATDVLDAAGVDAAHIVGASLGGVIAQTLTVLYPERVRSLTLACTSCTNHEWRRELLQGWVECALTRGMRAMTGEASRWVVGPRSFRRFAPTLGWLGPLAFGLPPRAFAAQAAAAISADDDLAVHLREIDVPTLVMVGNQDILTPRGDSEELVEHIATAELAVISGGAHGFMVEHFRTFNRLLLEFLERGERAWTRPATTACGPPGNDGVAGG